MFVDRLVYPHNLYLTVLDGRGRSRSSSGSTVGRRSAYSPPPLVDLLTSPTPDRIAHQFYIRTSPLSVPVKLVSIYSPLLVWLDDLKMKRPSRTRWLSVTGVISLLWSRMKKTTWWWLVGWYIRNLNPTGIETSVNSKFCFSYANVTGDTTLKQAVS